MKGSKRMQRMFGGITALAAAAWLGSTGSTAFAATGEEMFSDVPAGHWAYAAVAQLKEDGLVKGMGGQPLQWTGDCHALSDGCDGGQCHVA